MNNASNFSGHRARLRARFLRDQGASMAEYELLELLLMYAIPRRDVKPLAKELLKRFHSLPRLLAASESELKTVLGIGTNSIVLIHLIATCQQRSAKQQILNKHIISNWQALQDYCRVSLAELPTEEFHILLLNQQNHLIEDLSLGKGSLSDVVIYPREVVKQTLAHHARSVVLVHNHPGGGAKPSANDIRTTIKLKEALKAVDVLLFDHLVIARGGEIFSFKSRGLL